MNMKNIYKKIARKNGVSVEEVKRDMQEAADYACRNMKKEKGKKNVLPGKGDIAPKDVIKYVVCRLNSED